MGEPHIQGVANYIDPDACVAVRKRVGEALTEGRTGTDRAQKILWTRVSTPFSRLVRHWPDRVVERPPIWCSIDRRDGNQDLVEPMRAERKRRLFAQLVKLGFKNNGVALASTSKTDLAFIRRLTEEG